MNPLRNAAGLAAALDVAATRTFQLVGFAFEDQKIGEVFASLVSSIESLHSESVMYYYRVSSIMFYLIERNLLLE